MTFRHPGSDDLGEGEGASRPVLYVGVEALGLRLDFFMAGRQEVVPLVKVPSVSAALELLQEREFEAVLVDGRAGETPRARSAPRQRGR
jgi:hypothetical protein